MRERNPLTMERWVALDSLRGLAAMLVVLYHLHWRWHGYDLTLVHHGFYAVDFFFVLSGFVMAANYGQIRDPADLRRFVVKRAGRLLPLHFVVLLAFVLLECGFAAANRLGFPSGRETFSGFTGPGALLAQATLTFGLIPHLDWLWNHPCWSIAVEFWVYLLFAATQLLVRRGRTWLWLGLSATGLVGVAFFTPEGLAVTSGHAVFRCILSFFLGTLVHVAYRRARAAGIRLSSTVQVVTAGAAVSAMVLPPASGASLVIPFAFAASIGALAFEEGGLARCLAVRPLARLGELSFSIYLVHVPVWFALEGVLRVMAGQGLPGLLPDAAAPMPALVSPFGSTGAADALAALYLGLVLAVARVTYRRVEEPARAWSRKLADRPASARRVPEGDVVAAEA